LVDQEDKATDIANTRIPYASTLVQLNNAPIEVRGEKQWQDWAQDLVDQEDKATDIANTRIPYASTLVQTRGGPERFTYGIAEQEEEDHENLNLESTIDEVPNNFSFVHISNPADQDEELVKIEDRQSVPLNFRF